MIVVLIAIGRPIRMLQIACKNFVGSDRPHCKRTKAAPTSRFSAVQQMGALIFNGCGQVAQGLDGLNGPLTSAPKQSSCQI